MKAKRYTYRYVKLNLYTIKVGVLHKLLHASVGNPVTASQQI